jgi:acetyltransferase-like isoleucine patch superfamily enzyme
MSAVEELTLERTPVHRITPWTPTEVTFRVRAIRLLNYITNYVVNRIPSYRLRHAWYRRVLGVTMDEGSAVLLGCYIWFLSPRALRATGTHIGARTRINRNCCIDARGSLTIGADVSISPEVTILTLFHDHLSTNFDLVGSPVVIEDHVWIGARATILPGTQIGRGAVVAAGAVVNGTVPPLTVVAGVPARPVATRPEEATHYHFPSRPPLFE